MRMRRIVCHDTRFTRANLWLILIIMARLAFGFVVFKYLIMYIFVFNNDNKTLVSSWSEAIKQELNKFANKSLKTADSADDFDQLDVDHTSKDIPTIHQKIVSKAEKKFWNLDA